MSVRLWSLIIALILPPRKNQILSLKGGDLAESSQSPFHLLPSPCALLTNGGALTVVGFIRRGGATGKKVGVTVTAGASRNSALSSLEQEG